MRVLLALFLCLGAVAQTPSPSAKAKNAVIKNGGGGRKDKSNQVTQNDLPSPDTGIKQQDSGQRVYKVDVVTPSAPPRDTPLFPVYLWITGVGVLINALIWFAIFRQTQLNKVSADAARDSANAARDTVGFLEKQLDVMKNAGAQTDALLAQATAQAAALIKVAEATEKNAQAAKASADALRASAELTMNEKRARIQFNANDVFPFSQTPGQGGNNVATCWFKNYGPTVAFVIDSRARYFVHSNANIPADFSACRRLMYAENLPEGGETKQFMLLLEPESTLSDDEVINIRGGDLFLHVYGFVKHQDVYGRIWKTTIHVRWKMLRGGVIPGQIMTFWELAGPPEDNQETEEKGTA